MREAARVRMSEAEFTTTVIDLAKWHKWKVAHFRPAQMRSGRWATAMQGDIGYPDLTLARDGVVMFAELKSDTGRMRKDQLEWAEAIGATCHVWRPRDIERIRDLLR